MTRAKKRSLKRRSKKRSTKRNRRRSKRVQRGGDGSAALPDYDQMVVVAKPTSGEKGDPDTIPTVMSKSAFDDQVDKDIDDMVPSA